LCRREPERNTGEALRLRPPEPDQLCGPERGAEHTSGAGMDLAFIERLTKPRRVAITAGISPSQHRRRHRTGVIQTDQAMPETRGPDPENPLSSQCRLRPEPPERLLQSAERCGPEV